MLLKIYSKGHQFIDSLDLGDFQKPYEKEMYSNAFLAAGYESRSDTIGRNKLLSESIADIEHYIQQSKDSAKDFDEKSYYDLYILKSKVESPLKIKTEIASLKEKFPTNKEFFDALESSIMNTPQSASADPVISQP